MLLQLCHHRTSRAVQASDPCSDRSKPVARLADQLASTALPTPGVAITRGGWRDGKTAADILTTTIIEKLCNSGSLTVPFFSCLIAWHSKQNTRGWPYLLRREPHEQHLPGGRRQDGSAGGSAEKNRSPLTPPHCLCNVHAS